MKHLTDEQRQQFRQLLDQCDLREALLLIAGIVAHDVADYSTALDASDLVRKAANLLNER